MGIERDYIEVVKGHLHKLGDDLLAEDIDLLCQYIIIRFLKTSPAVTESSSSEEVVNKLNEFIESIYKFIVPFIMVVNSSSGTNNIEA